MLFRVILVVFFLFIPVACTSQATQPTLASLATLVPTVTSTSTTIPLPTFTPQPHLSPINYGPDLEDFPAGINPLTGREVADPSLLDLPAVLTSITNMPVTARPQAGPGFAPWIFEIFIGEGTTRFMGVFYGDVPRNVSNVDGGCKVRDEIIRPNGNWIGNRVWLDENENGQQDAWEVGIGGVCITASLRNRRWSR